MVGQLLRDLGRLNHGQWLAGLSPAVLENGALYEAEAVVNSTAAGTQNRASVTISFLGQVIVV